MDFQLIFDEVFNTKVFREVWLFLDRCNVKNRFQVAKKAGGLPDIQLIFSNNI